MKPFSEGEPGFVGMVDCWLRSTVYHQPTNWVSVRNPGRMGFCGSTPPKVPNHWNLKITLFFKSGKSSSEPSKPPWLWVQNVNFPGVRIDWK